MKITVLTSLLLGSIASNLVYAGDHYDWKNFCARDGYFGVGWMRSALYGMMPADAIPTVSVVWFLYAFTLSFLIMSLRMRLGRA